MFTKLFHSMLESSLWLTESHQTVRVWITMLLMSDWHGRVGSSVFSLAHRACVSLDECQTAIDRLSAADPYSRSKDYEGRRIAPLPDGDGWVILNFVRYRTQRDEDAEREKACDRMRNLRNGSNPNKANNAQQGEQSEHVRAVRHKDTDVDSDRDKEKQKDGFVLILDFWKECWTEKYKTNCLVPENDSRKIKSILKAMGDDVEKVKKAIARFLKSGEKTISDNKHPINFLEMNLNKFATDPPATPSVVVYQ